MPISTACPNCKALFRLPEKMAGKRVKCQKCQGIFVVPDSESDDIGGENVSVGRPSQLDKPIAEPIVTAAFDDPDEDVGPAQKSRKPPRRRADPDDEDDDDDYESSRKKKSKKKPKSSTPTILMIVFGVVGALGCLVCAGGVAVWFAIRPVFATEQDVVLGPRGVFQTEADLTPFHRVDNFDPAWGPKRHRVYRIQLEQGKKYRIDMISQDMDSFLHLIDDQNQVVARDDDGGGNLNARIEFTPPRTATYRIHTTSLTGNQMGKFTLIVHKL